MTNYRHLGNQSIKIRLVIHQMDDINIKKDIKKKEVHTRLKPINKDTILL